MAKGVRAAVETITPKKAKELLESQAEMQRPISPLHVRALSHAIDEGEWDYNGETIKIDKNGKMLDGQHRCQAVIASGKSIKTLVVYGLEPKVFTTIDQRAKARGIGDMLRIRGESSTPQLAAALKQLWVYQNGYKKDMRWGELTMNEVYGFLEQHIEIRDSIVWGGRVKKFVQPAVASMCHYIFANKHEKMADEFFTKLQTGENLSERSPILVLRNRLLWNKLSSKAKLPGKQMIAMFIQAWNRFREKKPTKELRGVKSGQKMPRPI